jgi:hypothetical protein
VKTEVRMIRLKYRPAISALMNWWRRPGSWVPLKIAAASVASAVVVWIAAPLLPTGSPLFKERVTELQRENQRLRIEAGDARSTNAGLASRLKLVMDQTARSAPDSIVVNDSDRRIILDAGGSLTGLESRVLSIGRARRRHCSSRGWNCRRTAGLLEAAEAEFQELSTANPDSRAAAAFLSQLRSLRQTR